MDNISIIEMLKGKMMKRADLEKKKFYDLFQIIAYHSPEHLIEIFHSHYKDKSDIKQLLTMITKFPGYVKLCDHANYRLQPSGRYGSQKHATSCILTIRRVFFPATSYQHR